MPLDFIQALCLRLDISIPLWFSLSLQSHIPATHFIQPGELVLISRASSVHSCVFV